MIPCEYCDLLGEPQLCNQCKCYEYIREDLYQEYAESFNEETPEE